MFSQKVFFLQIIFLFFEFNIINSSKLNQEFSCEGKGFGYYADTFNNCQTYHICNPRVENSELYYTKDTFSCSLGTVFDQKTLSCVHLTTDFLCSESFKYYNQTKINSYKPDIKEATILPKLNKKINSTIISANLLALNNSKEIIFDNKNNFDRQLQNNRVLNSAINTDSLINTQNKIQKPKNEEKFQKPKNEEKIQKPRNNEYILENQNFKNVSVVKLEKLNNKFNASHIPKIDEKILNLNNRLNYDSNSLNLRRIQIGRRIYYVFKNPRP